MSVARCTILDMENWYKDTHLCTICDALIEVTRKDDFRNIWHCGGECNLLSVEDATIHPTNERNEMETTDTQSLYNPNGLIALRRIDETTKENTYPLFKAVDLEGILNKNNLLEQRIEHQEKQIGKIIDNLTTEGWYNPNTDKAEVLKDICEILDHTPTQTMNWTVTLTVAGSTEVNLDEVEDFDVRYFLADNLSVDSNDFTTEVDSWDIDYVDSQDWQ